MHEPREEPPERPRPRTAAPQAAASLYARSLLEASLDPLVTISPSGKITDVNRATEEATGLARDRLVGTDFADYFTDPARARKGYQKVIAEGEVRDYSLTIRHTSGRLIDVLYNASIFRSEAGQVQGVFAAARDVTARLAAERELENHRRHLETLVRRRTAELEAANAQLLGEMAEHKAAEAQVQFLARFPSENPNPMLRIGKDLTLMYANAAAAPLVAQWNLRSGQRVPANLQASASAALASDRNSEIEAAVGGRVFELILAPVAPEGYVNVYGRDITRRVRATEALQKTADDLVRSNQDLEQFAYVASHDLQEPLRIVAGYLQLIERRYKDKLDADAHEFIAFAVDGAHRMQDLINDLLAYSRVGTQGHAMVATDVQAVLDRVTAGLAPLIQESGAVLTHGPLPTLSADPVQLGQLFQNLFSNAIKFRGEAPPAIHIRAERQDGRWLFRVKDNGIGIAPEYAERVFIIFQRLHMREKYAGTGIGLAICKRIVERHGGKIWVESKADAGSTFCFTL
jgi:PAS domain S-box-containing protein